MTGSGKTAAFLLPILQRLPASRAARRAPSSSPPPASWRRRSHEHLRALGRAHAGSPAPPSSAASAWAAGARLPRRRRRDRRHAGPAARPPALIPTRGSTARGPGPRRGRPHARHGLPARHPPHPQHLPEAAPDPVLLGDHAAADRGPGARDAARPGDDRPRAQVARPPSASPRPSTPCAAELKSALLVELLQARRRSRSAIVFTRTKHRANRLADFLERNGVAAGRIHGNRSQAQRTQALAGFKAGRIPVLVATDIAARGIDVEELSHVVNFDVPEVARRLRPPRGPHGARRAPPATPSLFVSPEEEARPARIERAIGKRLPRVTLPGFDYRGSRPRSWRCRSRSASPASAQPTSRPGGGNGEPRRRGATAVGRILNPGLGENGASSGSARRDRRSCIGRKSRRLCDMMPVRLASGPPDSRSRARPGSA